MNSDQDQANRSSGGAPNPGSPNEIGRSAGTIGDAAIGAEIAVTIDSNRASQVLNEGRMLAGLLHHEEFTGAHLMMVLSRTTEGSNELKKWNIKSSVVNQLCWKALKRQPLRPNSEALQQSNASTRVEVSVDILEVYRWAGAIAAKKKRGTLELEDLVEAIVANRMSPRFAHLIDTEPVESIFADTRALVSSIKETNEAKFASAQEKLTELQLNATELQKELPFARETLKGLQGSVDGLKTDMIAQVKALQSHIEKQSRKIRSVGFGLLAAIAIVSTYFAVR